MVIIMITTNCHCYHHYCTYILYLIDCQISNIYHPLSSVILIIIENQTSSITIISHHLIVVDHQLSLLSLHYIIMNIIVITVVIIVMYIYIYTYYIYVHMSHQNNLLLCHINVIHIVILITAMSIPMYFRCLSSKTTEDSDLCEGPTGGTPPAT